MKPDTAYRETASTEAAPPSDTALNVMGADREPSPDPAGRWWLDPTALELLASTGC